MWNLEIGLFCLKEKNVNKLGKVNTANTVLFDSKANMYVCLRTFQADS